MASSNTTAIKVLRGKNVQVFLNINTSCIFGFTAGWLGMRVFAFHSWKTAKANKLQFIIRSCLSIICKTSKKQ